MALYLLDTSIVTYLRHGHVRVVGQLAAHTSDTVAVTSINVEEVLGGWYAKLRRVRTKVEIAAASLLLADSTMLLGQFPIFPLTESALDRFDQLARLRLNIGGMDLKIAAIALELGAVVVTNNLRDFGRVPGLVVEDWSV